MIVAVLVFSLYLVLSVCITIPYFGQLIKPTNFTVTRLDTVLKQSFSNDTSFQVTIRGNSPFPDSLTDKMILGPKLKDSLRNINDKDKRTVTSLVDEISHDCELSQAAREEAIRSLSSFKSVHDITEKTYEKELTVNFESATQSIAVDKGQLFGASVNSFDAFIEVARLSFENTLQVINDADLHNGIEYKKVIEMLHKAVNKSSAGQLTSEDSADLANNINNLSGRLQIYPVLQKEFYLRSAITPSVRNGSEWGFLGAMANYLIKPQSSELVLLVGMFGFGLLGASLLSFQNLGKDENFIHLFKKRPLIPNFGYVLGRGFGAALIIYLATKGGLAIFSSSTTTDNNGYILLLTCFVGAIFSDSVWTKVRKNFFNNDNSQNTNSGNSGNANDNKTPDKDKARKQPAAGSDKPGASDQPGKDQETDNTKKEEDKKPGDQEEQTQS